MTIVAGTLIRLTSNRLKAVFIIENVPMTFTANVSPAIQPFVTYAVVLTFNNVNELTSRRSYNGRIGVGTLKLTLSNGPVIEGFIVNPPGVTPASNVNGTGTWNPEPN
ncbi:hypothetical protein ABKN59_005393 [Abortiporus biennis]